jgi:hypothetical protein
VRASSKHRAVGELNLVAHVVAVVLNGADSRCLGAIGRVETKADLLGPNKNPYLVAVRVGPAVVDRDDADGRGCDGGVVVGDDAADEVGLANQNSG